MLRLLAVLLSARLASAMFYHEQSAIDLKDAKSTSAYGFSLGYQKVDARLVIGAPLYDTNGQVFHCSVKDLKGKKCNEPVSIDFKAIANRTVNPDQHFYLGASIAATNNGFVTCAPLRTAYFGNTEPQTKRSAAFGVCFRYDNRNKSSDMWTVNSNSSAQLVEGGGGWSTLVDDKNDRIIISQFFNKKTPLCSKMLTASNYSECFKPLKLNLVTTYGQAMSYGNYFDRNVTCYAFSINSIGPEISYIDFYSSDTSAPGAECPPRLTDMSGSVGGMFGTALCSADVTGDGFDDLFVGAPAQVRGPTNYDTGAVQVYSKMISSVDNRAEMDLKLTIWGVTDGARFGTTLSTNDVNGDSYPELLVSAPFEGLAGVLYIICGYEIHQTLQNKRTIMTVSDLPRTQKIKKSKSFGFSLQPVADYNDNGSDELAVGAPEDSTVTMYQGIRAITANVTSEFTGNNTLTNTEFIFASCVTIQKPEEPKKMTTKLLVKNVLTGDKATFKNNDKATYEINLSDAPTNISGNGTLYRYCRDFYITSPYSCKVNTTASLIEPIETTKEFKNTWVTLSPQSKLTKETQPNCNCGGVPCSPKYSLKLLWNGKNAKTHQYIVGSSDLEAITMEVRNSGTVGCGACAIVRVNGAISLTLPCPKDKDGSYKCVMPSPFRTGTNKTIEIQLETNTISTQEKNLRIDVEMRKQCDEPEAEHSSLLLNYEFKNVVENVIVQGSTKERIISDAELEDSREDKLSVEQTFTIVNNQSFRWNEVLVTIDALNNTYVHNSTLLIDQPNKFCKRLFNIWKCAVSLAPNSTMPITVSSTIIKKDLAQSLKSGNTKIKSKLMLQLLPDVVKEKSIATVISLEEKYHKSTIGTILIAIGVGLLLLFIIVGILYKMNFFKRKNKEELEELKKEMRSRSVKSNSSSGRKSQAAAVPEAQAVSDPDHDFDMVDLIVDETPLEKSLSSEQLNSLAANPDSVKLESCPKEMKNKMPEKKGDKDESTHV